jgi:two-component system OmpR family sensor kinase
MSDASAHRGLGAPISAQVVALLVVVVAIGQVLTLAIALLVPPPRPSIYRLSEIAAALNGQAVQARDGASLERTLSAAPPALTGEHRGPSDQDRTALAATLGVAETRVRFEETPPPRPPLWDPGGFGPHRRGFGPPPDGAGRPHGPPRDRDWPGPHWRPQAEGLDPARRLVFDRFTAALQLPSGGWAVVASPPERFPTPWQQRVGLWFLGCLSVLGPVGYLFARRLAAPIGAFANAADRLGRDPNAPPLALTGPAEIGVAARAFNTMQTRLQRYVADRTSMLAAISHDLRTPLARVRFKMERASDELRASVDADLEEMEAMISAVLGFVRHASEIRGRAALDLLSVLECAVDDAVAAGGEADLGGGETVVVEADDLALKRLFANLIDNAVKYGGGARVRLTVDDDAAVVEIADHGPGLPSRELERVFEPFYRAEPSRNRETGGMGLGLAVARSIARAHGGDVTLRSAADGLTAIVRLPLARRPNSSQIQ